MCHISSISLSSEHMDHPTIAWWWIHPQKILRSLCTSMNKLFLSLSVSVSLYSDDGETIENVPCKYYCTSRVMNHCSACMQIYIFSFILHLTIHLMMFYRICWTSYLLQQVHLKYSHNLDVTECWFVSPIIS
jgi:hypothetical protein